MLIANMMFYILSAVMIVSGMVVITARNPVHSILFLILAFFNAAGLFLLLGAEFIAMLLVIVYVGAVAVLFLFVVMMLDIDLNELSRGFIKHFLLGVTIALVMLAELIAVINISVNVPSFRAGAASFTPLDVSNTKALGAILYTDYIYPFQISGVILLVAMIGAIVLAHRTRPGVKRQNVSKQTARKRSEGVELVKVQSRKGV
jgi:NADH-quinone oxidoreductase subunit J